LFDLFGRQRKGYFIEAGAYDGEMISNTLYLEKKMGWTGLLVEPNPDAFAELVNKKRRAHLFGHCLSTKTTPGKKGKQTFEVLFFSIFVYDLQVFFFVHPQKLSFLMHPVYWVESSTMAKR
jgi:hypothetical protein